MRSDIIKKGVTRAPHRSLLEALGISALFKELSRKKIIHLGEMTVTGKNVGQNIKGAVRNS
jgi:dihydroxy-acid dehydratase